MVGQADHGTERVNENIFLFCKYISQQVLNKYIVVRHRFKLNTIPSLIHSFPCHLLFTAIQWPFVGKMKIFH